MRILYFLDTIGRGGAEMQALDVCRNAKKAGFELTLVTAGGGALEEDFRKTGIEFIRLSRKFPVDIYLASQLRKIIRECEIDTVHGYQAVDALHLYLAARPLKNVKKVLSFQGFISDRKNRLASKFLIPRMDANIVVSRSLQKWLAQTQRFDTSKFKVVYNGADPERLKPSGKSLREEIGLSDETLLVGMVGNFYRDPRKDQLTVCRALPDVFNELDNVHCLFAGGIEPGAEDKMADCINFCIEKGINDRVHFLGARNDVPDILDALDIFVFSSLHEGLPVAVSEAMLAGVPMIVSDIEPLLEASQNGKFAKVFPAADANILSEKILGLLENQNLRDDLATSARIYAQENFSIDAHMQKLKSLYKNLVD